MIKQDYVYMIYDTKQSDICVAQFNNRKQVAEYFNTSKNSISSTITRGNLRKKRYRIEKVKL